MKRYVRASQYVSDELEYKSLGLIGGAVNDIVNNIYNEAILDPEDPRADYFVSNISSDDEVTDAIQMLMDAIKNATKRQMQWRSN